LTDPLRSSSAERIRSRTALALALVALASCGGGGSSTDVVDDEPATLELSPDTLRLATDDTARITATVRNASGAVLSGVAVTFATDDPAVATVDVPSGLVTAEGDGTTTIVAQVAPGGANLTKQVRVEVGAALAPAYLVGGYIGVAYADQVGPATGPGGAFVYAVTAGALPNGLTLSGATAQITGVPSASGAFFFEVTATNGAFTLSERYAITISTKAAGAFNLWFAYNGGPLPPANARNALNAALARWEDVVTGDAGAPVTYPPTGLDPDDCQLVDASLLNGAFIEDLAILLAIGPIDGPSKTLARAGPCGYGRQQRPAVISGQMLLDEVDATAATSTLLRDIIWHEIAHVLGVGTLWADSLRFSGTDSVRYYGVNGNDEWRDLGGAADGVPVEVDIEGHWDEGWFDGEIMTPTAENLLATHPISRMTIGALLDLGWDAALGEADPYSLPICSPTCNTAPARIDGGKRIPDVVFDRLLPLPAESTRD
jgi:hypothetical protein